MIHRCFVLYTLNLWLLVYFISKWLLWCKVTCTTLTLVWPYWTVYSQRTLYQPQPARCAKAFSVLLEYIMAEYQLKSERVRGATERLFVSLNKLSLFTSSHFARGGRREVQYKTCQFISNIHGADYLFSLQWRMVYLHINRKRAKTILL